MRVPLTPAADDGVIAVLTGRASVASDGPHLLRYRTRTGALLLVDDVVAGAFDDEHETVRLPLAAAEHTVTLHVEHRSLPTSGLPAGPGPRWNFMLARAAERPRRTLDLEPVHSQETHATPADGGLAVVGHAHLDVAWLWTYAQTRRKSVRTFATAIALLEGNERFVFTQSQPQLYSWVSEDAPELFERVRGFAREDRFDASGAAMWVEPDCNVPSGESLLRQLVAGIRYAERELGATPTVAWLPDSFGFPCTLPTLLRHAGVAHFATTKLRWNDTTLFPYSRFAWEGPDGSRVTAAVFASYEGGVTKDRIGLALERDEPLVVGYSDGGGGPTDAIVEAATKTGRWTSLGAWFERAAREAAALPVVRDELYLEYHRGIYTTHHDIKARNAALERSLGRAELALAWMTALRASAFFIDEAKAALREAWEIALRNQFHDVLPGTSIEDVYADAHAEYDRADALVARVLDAARGSLPRFARSPSAPAVAPLRESDAFVLDNGLVRVRVGDDGVIVDLRLLGGENLVHRANVLRAYEDRPAKWEAWNVDRGYERRPVAVEPLGSEATSDGVFVRARIGSSFAASRVSLSAGEPFVRVDLAVDWRERRTLLRCENLIALERARAFFGAPHGVVERSAAPSTVAELAKFEACGQRFGRVDAATPSGTQSLALLTLDTYGWSVAPAGGGGVNLGHSLLRGTTWPDPHADIGEHHIRYAFLPSAGIGNGALEAQWRRFAAEAGVPEMFSCDDPAIAVVATKPADDGDGIVFRARECDGTGCDVAIASAARATSVECADALERPLARLPRDASLAGGRILARFAPYGLRTFRVRLE